MTVFELLKKRFPDLVDHPHDWRVFGPMSLDDTDTAVIFYDSHGRTMREFEISIDGCVSETTDRQIAANAVRGKKKKG